MTVKSFGAVLFLKQWKIGGRVLEVGSVGLRNCTMTLKTKTTWQMMWIKAEKTLDLMKNLEPSSTTMQVLTKFVKIPRITCLPFLLI